MSASSPSRRLLRLAGVTVRQARATLDRIESDRLAVDLQPNGYLLDVVLSISDADAGEMFRLVRAAFGPHVYALEEKPLPAAVVGHFASRRMTVSVAESCTGGWVGAALSSPPGASEVFWGGVVAYDDLAKQRLLGVQESTLARHGAVSNEVAIEMARGVREISGTTWAVAVTGIAGPTGGTEDKPVGTVWIATVGPRESARLFIFPGGRRSVRRRSTQAALDMLRRAAAQRNDESPAPVEIKDQDRARE